MKRSSLTLLLAALAAPQGLQAAPLTVSSEPLGYTTTLLFGSHANGSRKNNFVAPTLVNAPSWRGTVTSVAGNQVALNGQAMATGAFNASADAPSRYAYFIQTGDGFWAHIVSNDNHSVTLPVGFADQLTAGEAVVIRRHLTITDYLGNNEVGLRANSSGTFSQADRIMIANPAEGGNTTIIASSVLGGTWITDDFKNAANFPIYPDQGVQISRTLPGDLTLETVGRVDTKERQIQINTGINILPVPSPTGTTLTALALYTGDAATGVVGSAQGVISQADTVSITTNGVTTVHFYSSISLAPGAGAGWYNDSLQFSGNEIIPAGSSIVVKRTNPTNSASFVWKVPAPEIR